MILIISDKHDVHADVVEKKIHALGYKTFRLNLDVESLMETSLSFQNDIWVLSQDGQAINNEEVSVVWFRRAFVELMLEEKNSIDPDFLLWKNEWNKVLLGFYLAITNLPTLCPLKPSYAAENKFLQYSIAKSIGFNIPEFITSNNKEKLIEFTKYNNDDVVLKLHHQDFYKVNDDYVGIYVNKITAKKLEDFSIINENPITLQKYINKSFEARYTVVGDEHFCCRIDSQKSEKTKIDWRRYDIPNTPHGICEAPNIIKEKVDVLMQKLNLNYGALDFIIDKNDNWFFLEINSMGQWLWIEDLTGLKISDAICSWLIRNSEGGGEVI